MFPALSLSLIHILFQMMARAVNEGGKVSPIAAIRNFQVLE